jgi:hypothetical protein
VLRICSAYDDVKLQRINDLQQFASQQYITSSITDKLRRQTEAYFNGFMDNWNQNTRRCVFSTTERTCLHRQAEIFDRNGVSICGAYAEYVLTVYRSPLSAVVLTASKNIGIQHNQFQNYLIGLI